MCENLEETDWEQKYKTLLVEYNKTEATQEDLKQENFNLRRELSREKETNKFASDELEIQYAKFSKDLETAKKENSDRIERLSAEILSLKELNRILEERNLALSEAVEAEKASHVCGSCVVANKSIQSVSLEESHFMEFSELKEKCTNLEMELHQAMAKLEIALQENQNLVEKIDSLENTLDFKRTELQEKQEQEELLQEKIMELNMEVNNLRMQPEDGTKKGNSLFAEVDDQRQKFRKLLNDQNDQYKQMKRAYQDGQLEIRRLRRENKEILEEMESCKELFKSSEAIFKQGLLEKIEILEQDREKQQQKMSKLEEAIASTPSTNWINTMLSYCRSETKTLKEKLFECLKQKSAIEESLLKSQQECAKFKFEASELKTKLRSTTESQVTTPPPPMVDDSMQEIDGNTEIDDSVQDFLKELSNEDRKENKKKKEEIDFKPYLSEPKFQSINVLQEKAENIVQTRNPAKKAPIVVKKIVIPSRAVKK